jgi:hypothetical protein
MTAAENSEARCSSVAPVPPRIFDETRQTNRRMAPLVLWDFCVAAGLIGIAVAGVVLYLFNPETARFYPVCAFHQLTGLQCPGCGSLRALHQLTHGNIVAAWRFNPLLIALLPLAAWLALREAVRLAFGWRWPGIITRPIVGWSLLVLTVVFGIARNLR